MFYESIDGNLYNRGATALVRYAPGKSNDSFVVPDSVNEIRSEAFESCKSLKEIELPENITVIREYTFDNCTSLVKIKIPDSVSIIEVYAFNTCLSLTSIIIPNSVSRIVDHAFFNSIVIPSSVTNIGNSAFAYCESFSDVYYSGSELDWADINIEPGNNYLTKATIHYNYVPEE